MRYYADLHIHSKYSMATSRDLDLERISLAAKAKGIQLVVTGDFTHPAWRRELKSKLVSAGDGVFKLKPEINKQLNLGLPAHQIDPTLFILGVEISTIKKVGDQTRKVHHLVYCPNFAAVDKLVANLEKVGNLASDGRPILGLDPRDLLEIVLDSGRDNFLIPAHIWTPWFSALGSKSGFDSIDECYRDLAKHIFAVETGLSSDPEMNWKVSHLDRFRLVSNSDAHSPSKLGRELTIFDGPIGYSAIKHALQSGEGYVGTTEFFPEEGKYHLDGHRRCQVRLNPEQSKSHGGRCPTCGSPLTLGVMYRVEELADRQAPKKPKTAGKHMSLVPLVEVLAEIEGVGVNTKTVKNRFHQLTTSVASEMDLMASFPSKELESLGEAMLAEGLRRLRAGEVYREAGYDGEFGRIKLFEANELERKKLVISAC